MEARLTVAGMTNYKPDLFDNLVLPTPPTNAAAIGLQSDQLRAAWTISKDDFVEFLCLRTAGMSIAIPDYNWLKTSIGVWSGAHIHEWQRMFDTLFYKYNPLWNKDGKVTETDAVTRSATNSTHDTGTSSGAGRNTGYTHGYDGGATAADDYDKKVAPTGTTPGNDGLSWTNADKNVSVQTATSSATRTGTDAVAENRTHTTTEQGNIGVTMSQELIAKERELALFSIEEYIADEFKKQFCLMIW